jgi:putative serine protease PepD
MSGKRTLILLLLSFIAGAVGGATSILLLSDYLVQYPEGPSQIINMNVTSTQEEVIKSVYEKVAPSVVHITSTVLKRNFFFEIIPQQGTGSGVVVDKNGYILTNNHVIADASTIEVTLANGKKYGGELIGAIPELDIAVIKVDAPPDELNPASFGNSDKLSVGTFVMAIGNPFGLDRTATFGIVSALNRSINIGDGNVLQGMIQTDASINPGNSGGPLVDMAGEVIGINTAILSTSGGNIGIGFAIPINKAKVAMEEIIKEGKGRIPEGRAWLGISGITIDEEISNILNLPTKHGALIIEVVPGSPADKAGLRGGSVQVFINGRFLAIGGDIIVGLDGKEIKSMREVVDFISSKKPGDKVKVTYIRSGEEHETTVTLGRKTW